MSEYKKYVVTLKNYDDLENFYKDMENYCEHNDNIPSRHIECYDRRPNSRNTIYILSDQEADIIRQDPRVLAVEPTPEILGIQIKPMLDNMSEYNSNVVIGESDISSQSVDLDSIPYSGQDPSSLPYNKSNIVSANYMNWGLLRCVNGEQIVGWGSNNVATVNSVVSLEAIGRNVDVVVVDAGNPNPDNPEYAVNYNGSGGSRMIPYDWFDLDPIVRGTAKTSSYSPADNNHSTHVSGTVSGNRQGWARGSNIYNISYNTNQVFDYVRAFHQTKPINSQTGLKNPTIMNNSWAYVIPSTSWSASSISAVTYRGTRYTAPVGGFTSSQLANWGVLVGKDIPVRYASVDADLVDTIAAGVITVAAAGNSSWKVDVPNGADWNNSLEIGGYPYYYHRGSSPAGNDTNLENIVVGATDVLELDQKVSFSNCGPGVDVYAPGTYIMSQVISSYSVKVTDQRNNSYYLSKMSGTSMASPQVCGIIACYLELYPRWDQSAAKNFILGYAKNGQLVATTGGYNDRTDLQGSENLHATYPRLIPSTGMVIPSCNYGLRPAAGQLWPRSRIFRYGS